MRISIEFEKTMKGFEEYPYDKYRGEDLIGIPITCKVNGHVK